MYTVKLSKHRATWNYWTGNPAGGGFGSNHCGTLKVALHMAIRFIPCGATVEYIKNGVHQGIFTKGAYNELIRRPL